MSKVGAPTSYTQGVADEIVRRLADGEVLRVICAGKGMPAPRTVNDWRKANDGFKAAYDAAMLAGCHALLDETLEIADDVDEDPASRKVRIWARHELVKRKRPDKFGDRLALANDRDDPLTSVTDTQLQARINELLAKRGGSPDGAEPA